MSLDMWGLILWCSMLVMLLTIIGVPLLIDTYNLINNVTTDEITFNDGTVIECQRIRYTACGVSAYNCGDERIDYKCLTNVAVNKIE